MATKKGLSRGIACLIILGLLGIGWAGKNPNQEGKEQKGTQVVLADIQRQTQIRYLEWSPTKNEALYVSVDNKKKGSIWVVNLNNKKKKLLINKGYNYSRPMWRCDGEKIICSFADSLYEGIDKEMLSDYLSLGNIWIIDVEKETKRRLPLNNKYSHIDPVESPNGKIIAYSSTEDCSYKLKLKSGQKVMKWAYGLHIINADGSNRKVLTKPKTDLWKDIPIGWSLDGERIIYYAEGFERPDIGIYSFNINSQEKKQIAHTWDYDILPHLEKIVYISPKDSNVWITNFDGSYRKRITLNAIDRKDVQWVSSQEIAVRVWESDTNSDGKVNRDDVPILKIVNCDTGEIKTVSRKNNVQKIKKSPKNNEILAIQNNKIIKTNSLLSLINDESN